MRTGNILIVLPFLLMLFFALCHQGGFVSDMTAIPAVMAHDDGMRTEYHDFLQFGNG